MTLQPGKLILDQTPEVLYDSNEFPSLDLRFAESKTLDDYVSGTPLVDHQRSMSGSNLSPGTFVNSSGLIETAKVNLLTYSEEFDNSGSWISTNASVNNAGTVVAPDGTFTTDALTENLTTNSLHSVNALNAVLLNGVYTFSVYVKAATRTIVALNLSFANSVFSTFDARAWFNLSNGTVGTVINALDATITPIGSNGWYRCTLISNSYSGANRKCLIASSTADGSVTHNGSGTDAIYIWGAQLEEGSTATTYIPTTNVPSAAPRFDHNPTTGESLGLLIEESRTNQLKYSGNLDNSSNWTTNNGSTANTTAPDGTNDAVIFTENTATDYHGIVGSGVNRPTMSGDITASVYIKPGTRRYVLLSFVANTNGVCVTVDTQNMTVSEATAYGTGYTYTNNSATIVSASNGWYRVSFAGNSSGSNGQVFIVRGTNIATGNTFGESYLGDGSTFSVWGAQLEVGSFATSYIPTAGTALTRNADVVSITGSNFSSWYNQSEGTVFVKGATNDIDGNTGWASFYQASSPNNNRISVRQGPTLITSAGTTIALSASSSPTPKEIQKISTAYKNDDFALYSTYSTPVLLSAGSVPVSVDTALLGGVEGTGGAFNLNGHISRLTYYPYRLADTRLQSLTA